MSHRPSRIIAMAAASALGLALLAGCPAEEKKDTGAASPGTATTTTTTTTTTTASAAPMTATSPAAATTTSAGSLEEGKTLFAARCQACHGANGAGGMGPALGPVDAKGDAYIKNIITKGSPAKGMPAFEGQLKASEIDAVTAYVKSL